MSVTVLKSMTLSAKWLHHVTIELNCASQTYINATNREKGIELRTNHNRVFMSGDLRG